MKKMTTALTLMLGLNLLAPLGVSAQEDFSIMMVTDVGGIDDKSFNQGAWEGMQRWGEEHGKEQGTDGYEYLHSQDDSDYATNLSTAASFSPDIVFAIGYALQPHVEEAAKQYPDQQFGMIDSTVDLPNVASLNFADEEAAFLAGVAAAKTTQTDKVAFLGGVEGVVIDKFEAGFVAGVEAVNPDIEVLVQYAGSFVDPSKGRTISASFFSNGADVIFHASGPTGNGAFAEAKDLMKQDDSRNLWIIGVDSDQSAEGEYTVDGETKTVHLTSTLKNTGNVIQNFSNQIMKEGFINGEQWFDLSNDGVGLAKGQLSDELQKEIAGFKVKIVDGTIEVPDKPE